MKVTTRVFELTLISNSQDFTLQSHLSLKRTPLRPAKCVLLGEDVRLMESNKRSEERQGPTLGVRFKEMSALQKVK